MVTWQRVQSFACLARRCGSSVSATTTLTGTNSTAPATTTTTTTTDDDDHYYYFLKNIIIIIIIIPVMLLLPPACLLPARTTMTATTTDRTSSSGGSGHGGVEIRSSNRHSCNGTVLTSTAEAVLTTRVVTWNHARVGQAEKPPKTSTCLWRRPGCRCDETQSSAGPRGHRGLGFRAKKELLFT